MYIRKYSKSLKPQEAGMWRVRWLLLVVYKIQLQIENTQNTQRPNTQIPKIFKVTKWGRHWGRHEGRWIGGACCLLSEWPTAPWHRSTIGEDDWPRMCTFSFDLLVIMIMQMGWWSSNESDRIKALKCRLRIRGWLFHKVFHMREETQIIVDLVHLSIIIASGWYLRSVLNGYCSFLCPFCNIWG